MAERAFTLLDDGRPIRTTVRVEEGQVRLAAAALEALGWYLAPEGLCREGLCVPLPAGGGAVTGGGVAIEALATLLDRPLALDTAEAAAYLGVSHADRAAALASLEAPDFALPDLSGRIHSLSEQRGRKVLLVAYASW
jgi:hypothetical protein